MMIAKNCLLFFSYQRLLFLAFALTFLFSVPTEAQIITYNFNGAVFNAPSSVNANVIANNINTVGSSTTISEGQGVGFEDTLRIFGINNNNTAAQAIANNTYFQFTVTPNVGFEMDLSSITFDVARAGASTPRGWVLRSSIDNFSSTIATADIPTVMPTLTPITVNLSGSLYQNVFIPTTFRFYYYSPAGAQNGHFDNIILNGFVGPLSIPEPGSGFLLLLAMGGVGFVPRVHRAICSRFC
jgi:hypothetical protein